MQDIVSDNDVANNTGAEICLEQIRHWLDQCSTKHGRCRRSQKHSGGLPTRVIDVGLPGALANPRLLITATEAKIVDTTYVTLSHCWGRHEFTTLLRSNLNAMQKEIVPARLPQTFQDAINITQRLGLRYLWIDSLCIMQDSIQDWQSEAAAMGNVYKRSFCTIAATGAKDGRDGLFVSRNPLLVSPLRVKANWGSISRSYCCVPLKLWDRNILRAPLNRRAWVLQERLLAPRTIHFGSKQVFWECCELEACETFPPGIPGENFEDKGRFKDWEQDMTTVFDRPIQHSPTNSHERWEYQTLPDDSPTDLFTSTIHDVFKDQEQEIITAVDRTSRDVPIDTHERWEHLVQTYMSCEITKLEDKLVALSGIAKEMQRLLQDDYLAGLWRRRLLDDLLWWVPSGKQANGRSSYRPKQYRSPSWSWASIEAEVLYATSESSTEVFATVLDAHVEQLGSDPTGQIASGYIKLRVPAVEIEKPKDNTIKCNGLSALYCADEPDDQSAEWHLCIVIIGGRSSIGLVLTPEGDGPDVYRRLGYFQGMWSSEDMGRSAQLWAGVDGREITII